MNDVNERKLEDRIHQELRSLPNLKAPRTLGPRVLAAIAARRAAPWFRRTWAEWPFGVRALFFAFGLIALGVVVSTGLAAPQIAGFFANAGEWFTTQFTSLQPVVEFLDQAANEAGVTLEAIAPKLLLLTLVIGALAYGTCVALGTLGYRLVFNRI